VVDTGEADVDGVRADPGLAQQRGQRRAGPLGAADGLEQPGLADRPRLEPGPAVAGALEQHPRGDGRPLHQVVEPERERAIDRTADGKSP
jgi:hypothetical protein